MSQYSPMPGESPERQAAKLARQSSPLGSMLGGVPRRRVVGRMLGLNGVIGLAIVVALLVGVGALTGKLRLTSKPRTDSVVEAVRDHLSSRSLGIRQGDIKIGGLTLLFIGAGNTYESARLAVALPAGTSLVNGTFGDSGKSWCVHVRQNGRDVTTTNLYEKVSDSATSWSCAPEGLLSIRSR